MDEDVSKAISLEQYKKMATNDAAETKNKDSTDEKDMPVQKKESPSVARISGPCPSVSTPRHSKKTGTTPRSAHSSAAPSTRGTFVKSKTGFSKYGHHTPPSSYSSLSKHSGSSKHSSSPSSSCVAKQSISSKLFAPKVAANPDASAVESFKHISVDDVAARFSQLFTGNCPYQFL